MTQFSSITKVTAVGFLGCLIPALAPVAGPVGALLSFVALLFFVFWLAILYAGADHPPPPGFIFVVLLDLVAAGLVYWRVPFYLAWIASRRRNALLFVIRDGLVVGLAFAAIYPGRPLRP